MLLENNGEKPKTTVEQEKNSKKSMLIFFSYRSYLFKLFFGIHSQSNKFIWIKLPTNPLLIVTHQYYQDYVLFQNQEDSLLR